MTKIEWVSNADGSQGKTWNPIVGCSVVSPGCTNCYAMRVAGRRLDGNSKTPHYAGTTQESKAGPVWTGKVALAPEKTLLAPLKRRIPTTYFVNSMGDLFHEDVPDWWIDRVFAVMALTPQHTYQVLTKRAKRMLTYLAPSDNGHAGFLERICDAGAKMMEDGDGAWSTLFNSVWPLPNVWLGISAEDQPRADERALLLQETPAAVRFFSCEPLLSPIDLDRGGFSLIKRQTSPAGKVNPGIDWVICGGESGPGARPMDAAWARSLRDQCAAADVAFFMKQMSGKRPIPDDLIVRQFPEKKKAAA